jgi:hypothetical protein
MTDQLYDKRGVPILRGDIVKVYHFTGSRRKRYYMYKQALGVSRVLSDGTFLFAFDHLDMGKTKPYEERGQQLMDYEVVQGCDVDFNDRVRLHD